MKKFGHISLCTIVALFGAACESNPTGDETGSVSLLITDAPGDFTRAIVTIERIELRRAGDEDDDSVSDGNRIVLRDEAWTGDLLELSNDVAEIASEVAVPAGTYSQLRFIISGGCIEVETEDGTEVYASDGYDACGTADSELHMPSFGSSGLKVNLPAGFEVSGAQRIVLIDFDVAESFGHQAGNSGRWVMHPVIRATDVTLSARLDVAVVLADSVDLPGELTVDNFEVQLGDEPPVAVVNGVASFEYLIPGDYSVDLVEPEGVTITTDPTLPLGVDVDSGEDADVSVTITAAS